MIHTAVNDTETAAPDFRRIVESRGGKFCAHTDAQVAPGAFDVTLDHGPLTSCRENRPRQHDRSSTTTVTGDSVMIAVDPPAPRCFPGRIRRRDQSLDSLQFGCGTGNLARFDRRNAERDETRARSSNLWFGLGPVLVVPSLRGRPTTAPRRPIVFISSDAAAARDSWR
ncbi:hypothetical protein [Nocardia sp. NPDC046763]|uniref:hypothetical protein n=1 Tax=Nocardia sp. NPDC046763 TaxID=3155256 RepID=UPI0033D6C2DB